jgi:hypothetical protein
MSDSKPLKAEQDAAAPVATRRRSAPKKVAADQPAAPAKTPGKAAPRARAVAKPGTPTTADSTAASAGSDKAGKHSVKKAKLVRDSFTFPADDYAQIGALKERALKAGHEVKKSELLRAGLTALSALPDAALVKALQAIDRLKPGRPLK